MGSLTFENVEKIYPGNIKAIEDFNLRIEDKEFIVLVGPSGCGKSTILRIVAGLEELSSGSLSLDNLVINNMAPKDRDIAMVFQNYALYPHMTVYGNMALGLELRKVPKQEIKKIIHETAELLGNEKLLNRKPGALSGGQRQRVALGRAIVRHPKVFLMDEPLSNLDAKLRVQMRMEIIKLHRRLETTFIYVTHDQTEAMTMGSRIVVMKDGIIQQVAAPEELYYKPINVFVAEFIGSPPMNVIRGNIMEIDGSLVFSFENNQISISANVQEILKDRGYKNKTILAGIRPEDIEIHQQVSPCGISIDALVDVAEMAGSERFLHLKISAQKIVVKAKMEHKYFGDETISIHFPGEKLHFFDSDTQMAIR